MGSGPVAHTIVLTAYMAGLGFGGLLIGRFCDNWKRPLRAYGWLELAIAGYGLLSPALFPWLQESYGALVLSTGLNGASAEALRFFLALTALLIPTLLMGGTLPVLVKGLTAKGPEVEESLAAVYGWNTFGAAFGALLAGYVLLPTVGVSTSAYFAVSLNLIVAIVVPVVLASKPDQAGSRAERRRKQAGPRSSATPATEGQGSAAARPLANLDGARARLLLVTFGASGFAALLIQIVWIRVIALTVGASAYAFSLTLTCYLIGIALGSLLYERFATRLETQRNPLLFVAALELGVAGLVLAGIPIIARLPSLLFYGYRAGLHESFVLFQSYSFLLSASIMIAPTILLGVLFPFITAIWTNASSGVGRGVGAAYFANTTGSIIGSFIGGLFLVPWIGLNNCLLLAVGLHLLIAAVFWNLSDDSENATRRIFLSATASLAALFIVANLPTWNLRMITSGPFVNMHRWLAKPGAFELQKWIDQEKLLFYADGRGATVSVIATKHDRHLIINGKTDASARGDLGTQAFLAQLPMLIHPDAKNVLVIGLGSGVTAGSTLAHQEVETLDVLELTPEVAIASDFFAAENNGVLTNPKTTLTMADARNFLLAEPRSFDVIISEPSNPWITGVSNLFTKEFFELSHAHIKNDGLVAQWFHTYSMDTDDVRTVLNTFASVFPHVSVWMANAGDLVLLGSNHPFDIDYAKLSQEVADPRVAAESYRSEIYDLRELGRHFVFNDAQTRAFAKGAPLNTDDYPRIEFHAPKQLYASTTDTNLAAMAQFHRAKTVSVPIRNLVDTTATGFSARALGLKIRTVQPPTDDGWNTDWQLLWTQSPSSVPGLDAIALASRQVLSWSEGDKGEAETTVWVTAIPKPESGAKLLDQLTRELEGSLLQSGGIRLAGEQTGVWGLRIDDKTGRLSVGVSWFCPGHEKRHPRYVAIRKVPDPGQELWERVVTDLAGRFECQPPQPLLPLADSPAPEL